MTLRLVDVSRWQADIPQPLDLRAAQAAGIGAVNVALTGSRGYTAGPWARTYVEQARTLGMGVCVYHWLRGDQPGAVQAEATWERIAALGGPDQLAHQVDCEDPAVTWPVVRDYVTAMQDRLGRHIAVYTGDWWWQPRGWPGADLTPYPWAAPNGGYLPGYPGDTSPHWAAGYGGWPELAVMQHTVGPLAGVRCSLSAIRDPAVWAALTGGAMTIPWLADELRAAGVTVVEHPGWKTHYRPGTWEPRYGIVHATAAPRTQPDDVQVRVVRDGRSDLPGPIANACVDRQGRWHVLSAGRCNTTVAGTAGPYANQGNTYALGVEACNDNGLRTPAEPWPDVQYRSYVRGWAAIAKRLGWAPDRLRGHREHCPGHKTDPTFSMTRFRGDVAAVLAGEDNDVAIEPTDVTKIADGVWGRDTIDIPATGSGPAGVWVADGALGWAVAYGRDAAKAAAEARAAAVAAVAKVEALTSVMQALADAIAAGGGSVDTAAILAGVNTRVSEAVLQVQAELRDAVADLGEGGATQVRGPQ